MLRYRVDPADDSITFPDAEPDSVYLSRHYQSSSGKDRVRLTVPSRDGSSKFTSDGAIKSFSHVVAIDSTYDPATGNAVVASYIVPAALKSYPNGQIPYCPLAAMFIHQVRPGVNPERIGWHLILTHHVFRTYRDEFGPLAIVVDSELGAHGEINRRRQGYYDDNFLPSYATLVYASDKDTSSLLGQMIKYCDRMGRTILQGIGSGVADVAPSLVGDENYLGGTPIAFRREPPPT